MKIIKIALGVLVLASLSVNAASINKEKSTFKWLGTKVTGKHFGTVSLKSGNIEIADDKIKSGKVVIDLKSINVTDLTGKWKKKLEGHLMADDFFNIKEYPTASLLVTKVYSKTIMAELTIKGKTHKVEFPYARDGKKITGTLTFDRTKFGMQYKSGNYVKDLGDKLIHDEVKLDYNIVLM